MFKNDVQGRTSF